MIAGKRVRVLVTIEASVANAPDLYRAMLRETVGPALREMGLMGTGSSYRVRDDLVWALLRFQSSIRNSAREVRFTINLAVIGKAHWARAQQWHHERWPEARPLQTVPSAGVVYSGNAAFAWDRRIGHLLPENDDVWWLIDGKDSVAAVAESRVNAVRSYGLPALLRERDRVVAELG